MRKCLLATARRSLGSRTAGRCGRRAVTPGLPAPRAALTTSPHMHLYVIYPVLIGFVALFLRLGIGGFRKRVLS